jgi:Mrp family chromosome partitioning ATPase/capsular polysaccharide biosynthesis protein
VLLVALVGVVGAYGYAKVTPKTYTSSVLVEVIPLPNNANALAGRTSGPVNMDNEAQVAQSIRVATLALTLLHSHTSPEALVKHISVTVPPNTTFLQIGCSAPTPLSAQECAQALGTAYLSDRLAAALGGVEATQQTDRTTIAGLTTQIQKVKTQLDSLPANSPTKTTLELRLKNDNALLATLQVQSSQIVTVLADLNPAAVGSVASPASRPTNPTSPRLRLVLPSGLLFGLIVGLGLAFYVDRRDLRIHETDDVERFLGLPLLLDSANAQGDADETTLAPPRSQLGREFMTLAEHVAAALGDTGHVLLVADTSTGSGCSSIVGNLAATMAITRGEVVLVCAGARDSAAPQLLGATGGAGLTEVLAGSATPAAAARQSQSVPRLRVIGPGEITLAASSYPQQETFQRLVSDLSSTARYVIIEVQSVGDAAEAFGLSEFADAAVLVIELDRTTRPDALDCLRRLDRLNIPLLGAVTAPPRDFVEPRPRASDRPRLRRRSPELPALTDTAHATPADPTSSHDSEEGADQPAPAGNVDAVRATRTGAGTTDVSKATRRPGSAERQRSRTAGFADGADGSSLAKDTDPAVTPSRRRMTGTPRDRSA